MYLKTLKYVYIFTQQVDEDDNNSPSSKSQFKISKWEVMENDQKLGECSKNNIKQKANKSSEGSGLLGH